jgi:hypothetical protein
MLARLGEAKRLERFAHEAEAVCARHGKAEGEAEGGPHGLEGVAFKSFVLEDGEDVAAGADAEERGRNPPLPVERGERLEGADEEGGFLRRRVRSARWDPVGGRSRLGSMARSMRASFAASRSASRSKWEALPGCLAVARCGKGETGYMVGSGSVIGGVERIVGDPTRPGGRSPRPGYEASCVHSLAQPNASAGCRVGCLSPPPSVARWAWVQPEPTRRAEARRAKRAARCRANSTARPKRRRGRMGTEGGDWRGKTCGRG